MWQRVTSHFYSWKYTAVFLLGLSLINLFFMSRNRNKVSDVILLDRSKLMNILSQLYNRHPDLKRIPTKSKIYDEIFSEINMYDFLVKHSFQDRCMIYFNHLSLSTPDWNINPHTGLVHNDAAFQTYKQFHEQKMKYIEKEAKSAQDKGEQYKPPPEEEIREEYNDIRQTVLNDEQKLHDYVTHVRVFNKCFMSSTKLAASKDRAFVKEQKRILKNDVVYQKSAIDNVSGKIYKNDLECLDIESRIFPWLTMEYPLFMRWDGKKSLFPGRGNKYIQSDGCFLQQYKSRLTGKGIVMTVEDSHVEEASRFLRLIRYLGNTHSVQIVYTVGLSEESKEKLVQAARSSFRGYPKQDLWFVHAERSIHPDFRGKFSGFSNKIMATMFNSFEEILLCDADTVLLESPSYFFKLKKYIDTGTFFYKDRSTGESRPLDSVVFFKKLLPSVEDSMVFNVNQVTNFTLENDVFQGFSHYMESGVVAINRKKHFIQPLMMSVLNFYQPVQERIYGDKELYWLALSLAGDESYAFNNNYAASIGGLTPEVERHKDNSKVKSFRSQEICSNHPAHISEEDDQTLVWFNSGFRFCGNSFKGKIKWQEEFDMHFRFSHLKSVDEYRAFFQAPLNIPNAIIPPFNRDRRSLRNIEYEPEHGWVNKKNCYSYLWCAYSSVGGYYVDNGETEDTIIKGKLITFTPEQVKKFEAAGEAWNSPIE